MKKFFKIYKGPGYPVDPKLEEERQLEQFNLLFNPLWQDSNKPKALDFPKIEIEPQEICIINEDEEDDLNYDMTIIKDYGCKLPPIKEPIFKNL